VNLLTKINKKYKSFEEFYAKYEDFLRAEFSEITKFPIKSSSYDTALSLGYIKASKFKPIKTNPVQDEFLGLMVGGFLTDQKNEFRYRQKNVTSLKVESTASPPPPKIVGSKLDKLKEVLTPLEYAVTEKFFSYDWSRQTIAKYLKIDPRKVTEIIEKVRKIT